MTTSISPPDGPTPEAPAPESPQPPEPQAPSRPKTLAEREIRAPRGLEGPDPVLFVGSEAPGGPSGSTLGWRGLAGQYAPTPDVPGPWPGRPVGPQPRPWSAEPRAPEESLPVPSARGRASPSAEPPPGRPRSRPDEAAPGA